MTRKVFIFEIILIMAAIAVTAMIWSHLPAQVATHWNLQLQPDRFSSRLALFGTGPGMMAGVMLLTWMLPWLSPKNFRIESFQATYRQVMLLVFILATYQYAVMVWAATGHPIPAGRTAFGGVCLFMVLLGNVMGKMRRNFFLGIRTPWTLANERVWNASNRLGGQALVVGGLLGLVLLALGSDRWTVYILLASALAPHIYSFVIYKQLERRGELADGTPREQGEQG
jgi:uncharacterized membrane protein